MDVRRRDRPAARVDDADGREQHACPEVELARQQEIDVRLFELELSSNFETLNERMFQLQFADESDARREAVAQEQHESVEVDRAVLMGVFVEVKVHVAGEWSRAGIAGGFAGWRCTRLSPRWCCDSERSSENQWECTDDERFVARL